MNNKWIKTSKALPPQLETVLFYTINDTIFTGWLCSNEITIQPAQQGKPLNVAFVTHWRALPKAPKFA